MTWLVSHVRTWDDTKRAGTTCMENNILPKSGQMKDTAGGDPGNELVILGHERVLAFTWGWDSKGHASGSSTYLFSSTCSEVYPAWFQTQRLCVTALNSQYPARRNSQVRWTSGKIRGQAQQIWDGTWYIYHQWRLWYAMNYYKPRDENDNQDNQSTIPAAKSPASVIKNEQMVSDPWVWQSVLL